MGAAPAAIQLTDVTSQTGITFQHVDGSSGQYHIPESVCAGLALFDYDGDGDEDIYFVNGGALQGTDYPTPPTNALYRNEGAWTFTEVTKSSGLGNSEHGLGVTAGDYDGDGDLDLFVSNYGPNALYRNNGDGTFTDVTDKAGVRGSDHVGAGACFLDADGDGDLDLFVSDYLVFQVHAFPIKQINGYPIYPGPKSYAPVANTLYRNNGDGTFTDVSKSAGIKGHLGYGMGMICLDVDNDADTDIVVANDECGNFLFQNDGTGHFQEVALLSGIAYDLGGRDMGNMGVDAGDFDNDGQLDLYMTSYQNESTVLYRNVGEGFFEDVTRQSGAGAGTSPHVTWGTGLVDFDNDGHRDLYVCCGHLQDNAEKCEDGIAYHVSNILYRNTGQGKFVDVSARAGDGLQVKLSSRGAAFDDMDNDGDVDVVVLNSRREPTLLRNDTPAPGNWLQVRLKGQGANANGVGARVTVQAGKQVWVDEVHSGRSYQSHYGMRLHFGLGSHKRADRIEVRWIGGTTDVFTEVPGNRCVTLIEGGVLRAGR
jgi:hypothetical protein